MEQLNKWIEENGLVIEGESNLPHILLIDGLKFLVLKSNEEGKLFDYNFHLIVPDELLELDFNYYLFEFGGRWFYTLKDAALKPVLNLFKYIGKAKTELKIPFIHLGIHGKYEILNGSRNYSDWCAKAKWLGMEALGICEENTLGGIIHFQIACDEVGIKPIFGETILVKIGSSVYKIKLYALLRSGWKTILQINKYINVDYYEQQHIEYSEFLKLIKKYSKGEDLVCVLSNDFPLSDSNISILKLQFGEYLFYQIDTVKWDYPQTDINYLNNIRNYLSIYSSKIQPILINDSYYLDKEEAHIKEIINKIGNRGHSKTSSDQYFKSSNISVEIFKPLFKDNDNRFDYLMELAFLNTQKVAIATQFKLAFGEFHLPEFNQSHLPVKYIFNSNEELFDAILQEGMEEVIAKGKIKPEKEQFYLDRVEIEKDLIKRGGFIDYFLILWDILRWCKENDILAGVGRGSAVGSVVAWLLDITKIDPISIDLLFERFLNEGRIKSLPDIDVDFESGKREEVKHYIERIYGHNSVCSVGAYKTLKIKSGLKDLDRISGGDYKTINFLTKNLDFKEGQDGNIEELFIAAQQFSPLKSYIQKNINLIHDLNLILELPYASSIHPCAIIILPKYEDEDIFDLIPVKREETEGYVSEWEGPELEKIGFLKEDILGLNQLDKLSYIVKLIKEIEGKDIDIYDLPIDDPEVIEYFKKGWTGDVFQFGSLGLTQYCKDVKPDSVDELTTMVALYRPGPIQSGAHYNYINYKFGLKKPEFDYGLDKVTLPTYGLYIFQEQVMKAVEVLGGFSPEETDDVRRAMGKKKLEVIEPYRKKFVEGAVGKGCLITEAEKIWQKLEVFSRYGFNKSHAAAYALTGYISQYLKRYYPLEFWITAFEFADYEENILRYMNEIRQSDVNIQIIPPDINNSDESFTYDYNSGRIYWSLLKIKYLGGIGVDSIITERNKNGKFYSFEETYNRLKNKDGVNIRTFKVLIQSGAFDEVEGVKEVKDRKNIMQRFFNLAKISVEEDGFLKDENHIYDWWWLVKQKESTGIGDFDYEKILLKTGLSSYCYLSPEEVEDEENLNEQGVVAGIVRSVERRSSKRGDWILVNLDCNNAQIFVNFWNNERKLHEEKLIGAEGKIMFIEGEVKLDRFKKQNVIYASEGGKVELLYPLPVEKKASVIPVKKGDRVEIIHEGETIEGIIIRNASRMDIIIETDRGPIKIIQSDIIKIV